MRPKNSPTDTKAPDLAKNEPTAAEPTIEAAEDVAFESSIRRDGQSRLIINYRVTNNGRQTLLALNKLPRRSPGKVGYDDSNHVYIEPQADGTVEISKRAYALPPNAQARVRELPGATLLAPGQSLAEEISVALPLVRRRPYMTLVPASAQMPDAQLRVRFCLGVAPRDGSGVNGKSKDRVLLPGYKVVTTQRLLCGEVQEL